MKRKFTVARTIDVLRRSHTRADLKTFKILSEQVSRKNSAACRIKFITFCLRAVKLNLLLLPRPFEVCSARSNRRLLC